MSRANCKPHRPARSQHPRQRRSLRDGSTLWWILVALLTGLLGPQIAAQPAAAEERLNPRAQQEIESLREQLTTFLASLPEDERAAAREALLAALDEAAALAAAMKTEVADDPVSTAAATPDPTPDRTAATETSSPEATEVAEVTEIGVAPAAATETVASATMPPPPAAPPVVERRRVRPPRCTTLLPFDENDDGKINAQDRWWRYLYVWIDRNGDRQAEEREIESAYDEGVREIAADLDGFYRRKGSLGEIRTDDVLLFDLDGNGFGGGRRVGDGALAVDATALRRGSGPSLQTADGTPIEGIQPFEPGWRLVFDDGRTVELTCRR